jgi:hypothetical protein
MTIKSLALAASFIALSINATADVTITMQNQGKASFINMAGESSTQIKGNKQRTEQVIGGKPTVAILDVDGRRFIDLNKKKKSALVTPLDSISKQLEKAGVGVFKLTLTKTKEIKTIASYPCTVHNLNLTVPFSPTGTGSGLELTMVMTGTLCLSTAVPGLADYQTFYRAAADSGFIFGDPRAAKSPSGAAQAKAYAAMTKKMAEAGMALDSQIKISATGEGPLAPMMAKLVASDIHTTVTKIEVSSLNADAFEIPEGYKVKTQK